MDAYIERESEINEVFEYAKKENLPIVLFCRGVSDSAVRNIKNILLDCEIKPGDFEIGIKDQKIKDELKDLTNLAFKSDVFGAPTFIVNKKIFWGQDRLEYALDEYNS